MSNPIQQAIDGLEWIQLVFTDDTMAQERDPELWLPRLNEALSALQSLQGVELPPLPEPYTELYKDLTPVLYEAWSQQMQAYARTAVAAAMARGAVPQGHRVFLVATGELHEGEETYTRHDDAPPPLCDAECLYAAAPTPEAAQPEKRPENCGTGHCSCVECPFEATQPTQAEAPSVTTSQTVDDLIADSERERKSAAEWQQWVERGGYDGGQQAEVPSVAALFKEAAKNIYHADDNGLSAWERRNVRELSMMLKAFKAALATQQAGQGETAYAPLTGKVHELKTDATVFSEVVAGRKLFEIRKDDRGFACGDLLRLRETTFTGAEMAAGEPLIYTGQEQTARVIGILRGPKYGLADGWVIMSIATPPAPQQAEALAQQEREPMTDAQIEKLREATFSTNNPFCPVDSKSMRKAVRAAESFHRIRAARSSEGGGK